MVVAAGGAAQVSAVVAAGIVCGGKSDAFHGADHEYVADDGHGRGGGGGGEAEGAHFGGAPGGEGDGCQLGQRAVGVAGDDDEGDTGVEAAHEAHELHDFAGLAGVGDEQHDVVGLEHTQVAVLGFGGMEVDGGGAGRGEGGCDVEGYLAGFAHAGGDQLAVAAVDVFDDEVDGAFVGVRDGDGGYGAALGIQDAAHDVCCSAHFFGLHSEPRGARRGLGAAGF